jgi:hypothetical protein
MCRREQREFHPEETTNELKKPQFAFHPARDKETRASDRSGHI